MKRDMDLIREILLYVEENCQGEKLSEMFLEGHDETKFWYHVDIMIGAGYLDGAVGQTNETVYGWGRVAGLTWQGHELLDTIRDPGVWNKTKEKLGGATNKVTISIILQVAGELVKQQLGLSN